MEREYPLKDSSEMEKLHIQTKEGGIVDLDDIRQREVAAMGFYNK